MFFLRLFMRYFLNSSGAPNQTDCFSHLWGIGACWSSSGDWGCVSIFFLREINQNKTSEHIISLISLILSIWLLDLNGLHLYRSSLVFWLPIALCNTGQHLPIHTHIHTQTAGGFSTKWQLAHRQDHIHTPSHTSGTVIMSKFGLIILPTDISTCRPVSLNFHF